LFLPLGDITARGTLVIILHHVTFSVNGPQKESSHLLRPPIPALSLYLVQNGLSSPEQLFGNSINEFGQSQVYLYLVHGCSRVRLGTLSVV